MQHPWDVNKEDMLTVPDLHANYNAWSCVRSACSMLQFPSVQYFVSTKHECDTQHLQHQLHDLSFTFHKLHRRQKEVCVFVENTPLALRGDAGQFLEVFLHLEQRVQEVTVGKLLKFSIVHCLLQADSV
jgi:hypothetical protein